MGPMSTIFIYGPFLLGGLAMLLQGYASTQVWRKGVEVQYGDLMLLAALLQAGVVLFPMFGGWGALLWAGFGVFSLRRALGFAPASLYMWHQLAPGVTRCFDAVARGDEPELGRLELMHLTPSARAFLVEFGGRRGEVKRSEFLLPMRWRSLLDDEYREEEIQLIRRAEEVLTRPRRLVDVLDDPDPRMTRALMDVIRGATDDVAAVVRARLWRELALTPDDFEGQVRCLADREEHHARFLLHHLGDHGPPWVSGALQDARPSLGTAVDDAITALRARHGDAQLGRLSVSDMRTEGALSEARVAVERS